MSLQRLAIGIAATALMAGWTFAFAQPSGAKKPLGKMTCDDFLAIDDTIKPKVVYWAAAYGKGGKPENAVLDIEGTEKIVPALIEECKKAPKVSFWQKVREALKTLAKKM